MKLKQIVNIAESLDILGQIDDLFCAYPVAKNIAKVREHVELFSHEKKEIIDKFVLRDEGSYRLTEDGKSFDFGAKLMDFEKAIEELRDKEIDIEFETFSFEDIKDGKGEEIKVSANLLANLIDVIIK